MSIVVFGADYLGGIEKNLSACGVTKLVHVSGRKALDRNKSCLPKTTAFILVLTDFVNHNTAKAAKTLGKSNDIPVVYAKRSWCSVEEKLKDAQLLQ